MSLRIRLLRLAKRFGPPRPPRPPMSAQELLEGIQRLIGDETYNRGIFDSDPEFRPTWSHYHDLWQTYTHGYLPLEAVWLRRTEPDFEEARRRVVEIIIRVASLQPSPVNALAEILEGFERHCDRVMWAAQEAKASDQPT
jgi:hypothetical protein